MPCAAAEDDRIRDAADGRSCLPGEEGDGTAHRLPAINGRRIQLQPDFRRRDRGARSSIAVLDPQPRQVEGFRVYVYSAAMHRRAPKECSEATAPRINAGDVCAGATAAVRATSPPESTPDCSYITVYQ